MKKGYLFCALFLTNLLFVDQSIYAYDDELESEMQEDLKVRPKRKKRECELLINQKDEEALYAGHGFTKGDLIHLYEFSYDPNTVMNIDGKILRVFRVKFPNGECYVVGIMKTDRGDVLVNFATIDFLDNENLVINEGDRLQVTGSETRINGRNFFVASKVIKDGRSVELKGYWSKDETEEEN